MKEKQLAEEFNKRLEEMAALNSVNSDQAHETGLEETVQRLRNAKSIIQESEAQDRIWNNLQAAIQREAELTPATRFFSWFGSRKEGGISMVHGRFAKAVTVLTTFVLLFGGLNYASAQSMPGSVLYPVKKAMETVDELLTPSVEGQIETGLEHVTRRLEETKALIDEDRQGETGTLLSEAKAELKAARLLIASLEDPAAKKELMGQLQTLHLEMVYLKNAGKTSGNAESKSKGLLKVIERRRATDSAEDSHKGKGKNDSEDSDEPEEDELDSDSEKGKSEDKKKENHERKSKKRSLSDAEEDEQQSEENDTEAHSQELRDNDNGDGVRSTQKKERKKSGRH